MAKQKKPLRKLYTEKPRIRIEFEHYTDYSNTEIKRGCQAVPKKLQLYGPKNNKTYYAITLRALNKSANEWLKHGDCLHNNLPYPCHGLYYD